MSSLLRGFAVACLAACFAPPAGATVVTINNPSFESQVLADGVVNGGVVSFWNEIGTGTKGHFNPNDSFYTGTTGSPGTLAGMNGPNIGFIYQGDADAGFTQTTTVSAAPLTTYTLTAAVGVRSNVTAPYGGYSMSVRAGSTTIASQSSLTAPAAGPSFTDVKATAATGMSGAELGQPLSVHLLKPSGATNSYSDYDNIRLEARPLVAATYTYGPGTVISGAVPSTSPAYPDNTGGTNRELTNGLLPGSTNFNDVNWVGFQDNGGDDGTAHPLITFDLGKLHHLDAIVVSYLHSTTQAGGSITAPEGVYVSLSLDGISYSAPILFNSEFDHSAGDAIRFAILDFDWSLARYVRMDFRNTSVWTFLGEVSFNAAAVPEPSTVALLAAFGVIALSRGACRLRRSHA